jgi:hypothetical protein
MREFWRNLMSGLLGSLTRASRELIDGLASDCHDDSSAGIPECVLALEIEAGHVAVFASAVRFK